MDDVLGYLMVVPYSEELKTTRVISSELIQMLSEDDEKKERANDGAQVRTFKRIAIDSRD